MLSQSTLDILRKAGWRENRRVDTLQYEQVLQNYEFLVFPLQLEFLARFGGLRIKEGWIPDPYGPRSFHFDVLEAISQTSPSNVQSYSEDIGLPLSVLGELRIGGMNYHLHMAPEGQVYATYEDRIERAGSSGEEAIEAICTCRFYG